MRADHFDGTYTLKANTVYTTNGTVYRTDSLGRIVSFDGSLFTEPAARSPSHQKNLPGKMPGEDSGHLIASSNGGSGKVDNLVRMDRAVNQRDYRAMERENTALLEKGNEVDLHGSVTHPGETNWPDCFMVTREVTDPNTGVTDTEHFSWSNTDMENFEGEETWASLASEFPNPGAEQETAFGAGKGFVTAGNEASAEHASGDFVGTDDASSESPGGDSGSGHDNGNSDSDSGLSL